MSYIFYKSLKRNSETVESEYKNGVVYYRLPKDVFYCKSCVISNQRPNSEYEFKHTAKTKKRTIVFRDGLCDACYYATQKKTTVSLSCSCLIS